jgi:hypothetical protein
MENKMWELADKITYKISILAFFGLLIFMAIKGINYILNIILL